MLKGKKILIGVTGSIAAYKIPLLIRLLVKEGAEVKIISTEAAKDFVTPLVTWQPFRVILFILIFLMKRMEPGIAILNLASGPMFM